LRRVRGGCFWHNEGNRGWATIDVSTEHGLIWTVAILVHETCHAIQYHEGRPPGFDLEQECYAEDDRILRTAAALGLAARLRLVRPARALPHPHRRGAQEERQCDAGDPQADPRLRGQSVIAPGAIDSTLARARQAVGCYVRGSRIIVLRRPPEGQGGPAQVRERADALKRLAGYSQAFWLFGAR